MGTPREGHTRPAPLPTIANTGAADGRGTPGDQAPAAARTGARLLPSLTPEVLEEVLSFLSLPELLRSLVRADLRAARLAARAVHSRWWQPQVIPGAVKRSQQSRSSFPAAPWRGAGGIAARGGWHLAPGPELAPWAPPPLLARRRCDCLIPGPCDIAHQHQWGGPWEEGAGRELQGLLGFVGSSARPPGSLAGVARCGALRRVASFLHQREDGRLRAACRYLRYRPALGSSRNLVLTGQGQLPPARRCFVAVTSYFVDELGAPGTDATRRHFHSRICGPGAKWADVQYFCEDNPRYGRFRIMLHWSAARAENTDDSCLFNAPLLDWDRLPDKDLLCYAGYGRCEWDVRPYVQGLDELGRFLGVDITQEAELMALWDTLASRCALIEELAVHAPAVGRRFHTDLAERAREAAASGAAGARLAMAPDPASLGAPQPQRQIHRDASKGYSSGE